MLQRLNPRLPVKMYRMRKWAVSHASSYNKLYELLEKALLKFDPIFSTVGYQYIESPITFLEKNIKGFLFDCQMCGQCVLHETGMSCPMNCPKQLRNGPCGGVRPNGTCEVKPEMPCVWVETHRGNKVMQSDQATPQTYPIHLPVDFRLKGKSSWLREVRAKRDEKDLTQEAS